MLNNFKEIHRHTVYGSYAPIMKATSEDTLTYLVKHLSEVLQMFVSSSLYFKESNNAFTKSTQNIKLNFMF